MSFGLYFFSFCLSFVNRIEFFRLWPVFTVVTLAGITSYSDCNVLIYRVVITIPLYNAHKC